MFVQVGATAVAPPDDVMQLAAVVVHLAARDGIRGVQGRAAPVVADDHGVDVGVTGEVGEHPPGGLDGNREIHLWSGGGWGVGVNNDEKELGSPQPLVSHVPSSSTHVLRLVDRR